MNVVTLWSFSKWSPNWTVNALKMMKNLNDAFHGINSYQVFRLEHKCGKMCGSGLMVVVVVNDAWGLSELARIRLFFPDYSSSSLQIYILFKSDFRFCETFCLFSNSIFGFYPWLFWFDHVMSFKHWKRPQFSFRLADFYLSFGLQSGCLFPLIQLRFGYKFLEKKKYLHRPY